MPDQPAKQLWHVMSVRFTAHLLKAVREFAQEHGLSISDVVRQACVEYLERCRGAAVVMTVKPSQTVTTITTTMTAAPPPTSGGSA